jgi:predicted permease
MLSLLSDLRLAARTLTKTLGTTIVALLSLGLGIGAVTTVYTWTDRFLLHPLPVVTGIDRLVWLQALRRDGTRQSISYPLYRDWAERNHVFEGLGVKSMQQVGVREHDGEGAERAWGILVSDNYFDIMGARAKYGRTFFAGEENRAAQVAVLGYDFWSRRFRGDPSIVGRSIVVNGRSFEVIGVMPPRFGGSYVGLNLDIYVPITTYQALLGGDDRLKLRGSSFLEGLARLKPGVSLEAARDDMRRVGEELERLYPETITQARMAPMNEQGAPEVLKPVFAALLGVTGLVLLIACANVANLLLVRAQARSRELGVRLALGAGRRRLIRQLMTESALLAAGGGAIGISCAQLGRQGLLALIPPVPFPVATDFQISSRVLAFALGLAAVTVVVFGLWPALRASRPDLLTVLKDSPTGDRGRGRARSVLVGAQVALAVVSLVCAGLFLRAIDRAHKLDPGFRDPASLLLVETDLTIAGLADTSGREAMGRLLDRVRALPGVKGAGVGSFVPLGWSCCSSVDTEIEGYTPAAGEALDRVYSRVGDGYFETMGIELKSGRSFGLGDRAGAAPVVIVNEAFARRYWPGRDPIGLRIKQFGTWSTVVGVARDGHYRTLTDVPFPWVYRPWGQSFDPTITVHVRAAGDPKELIPAVRRAFQAVNVDLPFLDPRSMSDQIQQSTVGQGIGARTLVVFGGLALLLAAIGIYGVMAYSVSQRTREIGVRVAIGAAFGDVTTMVVRQGLVITGVGLLIGGVLALGAGQLLRSLLLGVSPADPATYLAIAAALAAVTAVASIVPARRAAKVDPIVALKSE